MRKKTEERRQAIVAVASQVFEEKGYSESTMSEIAARLGGSKATLYSYFPSKEDLLLAVVESGARRDMAQTFARLHTEEPIESRLRSFAVAFARLLTSPTSTSLRRLAASEAGRSNIGRLLFESGPRPFREEAARMLKREMDAGRLRQADPVRAFQLLSGMVECEPVSHLLFGVVDRLDDATLVAAANSAVDVFLRAYAPEA